MKKKYGSVFKEIKVILLILLSGILLMPSKSSAHLGDYFSGVYVASAPSQPSYMNFMVSIQAAVLHENILLGIPKVYVQVMNSVKICIKWKVQQIKQKLLRPISIIY